MDIPIYDNGRHESKRDLDSSNQSQFSPERNELRFSPEQNEPPKASAPEPSKWWSSMRQTLRRWIKQCVSPRKNFNGGLRLEDLQELREIHREEPSDAYEEPMQSLEEPLELLTESAPRSGVAIHYFHAQGVSCIYWRKERSFPEYSKCVVIWLAGGGWNNPEMRRDQSFCTQLCEVLNIDVIAVQGNTQAWPSQAWDIVQVIEWTQGRYTAYALGGVSSGSHLGIAALVLLSRLTLAMPLFTYLVAPVVRINSSSLWRYKEDPEDKQNLNKKRLQKLIETHFQDQDDEDPLTNPINLSDEVLRIFPPTKVAILSDDILTEDIEMVVQKWSTNWKSLQTIRFKGPHYLMRCDRENPEALHLRSDIIQEFQRCFTVFHGSINTVQPHLH